METKRRQLNFPDRCKTLESSEDLTRHNRAWLTLAVTRVKEYNVVEEHVSMYRQKWNKGHALKNDQGKLVWDFDFTLRDKTASRRPELIW